MLSLVLCVPFKKNALGWRKTTKLSPKIRQKIAMFSCHIWVVFSALEKWNILPFFKPKNLPFQVECSEEPLSHELTNPPEAIREEVVEMTEDIKNNEENQEAEKLVLNDETAKDSATASISSSSASRSSSPSLEESKEDESPEEEEEESSVEASK